MVSDCQAAGPSCQLDAQSRPVRTTHAPACNAGSTACLTSGAGATRYCDQQTIACSAAGDAIRSVSGCSGTACATTTTLCPSDRLLVLRDQHAA